MIDAGTAATRGLAGFLCLAATPTFAAMALLTGVLGGGPVDVLCAAGHGSPLDGMAPMYLLMGAFHSSPWLKLISGRRRASAGHDRAAPDESSSARTAQINVRTGRYRA